MRWAFHILFVLTAGLALAQTPTPLADDALDPAAYGFIGWTEQPGLRGAAHAKFTKAGEGDTKVIVWGRPLFYWRSDVGKWRQKRPKFVTSGSDDVTVDNDLTVRLTTSPARIEIIDPGGNGVAFPLSTRAIKTSDTTFTASVGAIALTYTLTPYGVKAEAVIAAKQGRATWTVNYTLLGTATASIDAATGDLLIGGFRIPRPFATGANARRYEVSGPWSLQAGSRAQVTIDDSALPAEAVPYVLDPTTAVELAYPNDGSVGGPNATYATARADRSGGMGYLVIGQELSGGNYNVWRSFLNFPTGDALPDNATVATATLTTYTWGNYSTTEFDIKVVESDWNDAMPPSQTDWDNAITATPRYQFQNTADMTTGWYTSSALGTSWISLTGTTDYVLVSQRDIDGTTPTGAEFMQMRDHDDSGGLYKPYLTITYTVPPGCCNCSGIITWSACQGPVLVDNTPVCPTQTPNGPACTYEPDSTCIVK